MGQESIENSVLHAERYVALGFVRLPVADKDVKINRENVAKLCDQVTQIERRPRRTVSDDQWRTFACHSVTDVAAIEILTTGQLPVVHFRFLRAVVAQQSAAPELHSIRCQRQPGLESVSPRHRRWTSHCPNPTSSAQYR